MRPPASPPANSESSQPQSLRSNSDTLKKTFLTNNKSFLFILLGLTFFLLATSAITIRKSQTQQSQPFTSQLEATPTPRSSNISLQDEVPQGWKTYRNEKFKFEFKYPEDWNVNDRKSSQILVANFDTDNIEPSSANERGYIIIRVVLENHNFSNLKEWLEDWKLGCKEDRCQRRYPENLEWTNIGGLKAAIIDDSVFGNFFGGKSRSYYIIIGTKLFEISTHLDKNQENNQEINQILSTFEFLE